MIVGIKFKINGSLYLRDPQDTELGKRILKHSIILLNEIGLEAFNFKKLANEIGSAEKSIYRYFDNKHHLLLFLTTWYWEWVNYLILTNVKNVVDPEQRLRIAIKNIVYAKAENAANEYINESILHNVVINEGNKAYHTVEVDSENSDGVFLAYKQLVKTIADLIKDFNPQFPYCTSLASNLFEMANNQMFFWEHLPRMTSLKKKRNIEEELITMLEFFVFKLLA